MLPAVAAIVVAFALSLAGTPSVAPAEPTTVTMPVWSIGNGIHSFSVRVGELTAENLSILDVETSAEGHLVMVMEVTGGAVMENLEILLPVDNGYMRIYADSASTSEPVIMRAESVTVLGETTMPGMEITDRPHKLNITGPVVMTDAEIIATHMVATDLAIVGLTQGVVG